MNGVSELDFKLALSSPFYTSWNLDFFLSCTVKDGFRGRVCSSGLGSSHQIHCWVPSPSACNYWHNRLHCVSWLYQDYWGSVNKVIIFEEYCHSKSDGKSWNEIYALIQSYFQFWPGKICKWIQLKYWLYPTNIEFNLTITCVLIL